MNEESLQNFYNGIGIYAFDIEASIKCGAPAAATAELCEALKHAVAAKVAVRDYLKANEDKAGTNP